MNRIELTTATRVLAALAVLFAGAPRPGMADDPAITATVTPADGATVPKGRDAWGGNEVPSLAYASASTKTPIDGNNWGWQVYVPPGQTYGFPPGSASGHLATSGFFDFRDALPLAVSGGVTTLLPLQTATSQIVVQGSPGFFNGRGPDISCSRDGCSGSIDVPLYSMFGNVAGTVYFYDDVPAPAGYHVTANDPDGVFKPAHTTTDGDGHFDFRAFTVDSLMSRDASIYLGSSCPVCMFLGPIHVPPANNWGLGVLGDGCGDSRLPTRHICSAGPGSKHWVISSEGKYLGTPTKTVNIHSNELVTIALKVDPNPPDDQPPTDIRPPREHEGLEDNDSGDHAGDDSQKHAKPPCAEVLRPILVTSGNMFLDQQDGAFAGFGRTIDFTRSYNSQRARRSEPGIFGAGWSHSFEQRLLVIGEDHLRLDLANGNAVYFVGYGEQTFRPYAPGTDTSIITKTGTTYVRTFPLGGTETYDDSGRLVALADRLGHATVLAYADDRLISITDSNGRAFALTYNDAGRPVELRGPDGLLATYTWHDGKYDVDYPDGTGYRYDYANYSQLTRMTDAAGEVIESHLYDDEGRATTSEIELGEEKYTLSYQPNATIVTDALGHTTTFEYGRFGGARLVTKISGYGTCNPGEPGEWTYDERGRISSVKDGSGRLTSFERNAQGRILVVRQPMERTIRYTRDSMGRVTERTAGARIHRYTHGNAGLLSAADPDNRTTTFARSSVGKPQSITDARGKNWTVTYTTAGSIGSATDPLQHSTTFTYDARGRRTGITDALGRTVTTTYDARDRLTRRTLPDGSHAEFAYDASGRLARMSNHLGRQTRFAYDRFGRLLGILDPTGRSTAYGYDLLGRAISIRDHNGNTTLMEYDAFKRVKKTTNAAGGAELSTYDGASRIATKTDRRGAVTTYSYDDLGRMTTVSYSDGTPSATFTYSAEGRLISAANGSETLTWTYNDAGAVLSEQSALNGSTVAYGYDEGGLRTSVSLNGQVVMTFGYDNARRLISIGHGSETFGFSYDAVNERTTMSYPNDVVTTYDFNVLSQATSVSASVTGTSVLNIAYTFDRMGNLATATTPEGTESYTYDDLSRLVRAVRTGVGENQWIWKYDPDGNRTGEQVGVGQLETAAFNAVNQLVSRDSGGSLLVAGSVGERSTVTVNGVPAQILDDGRFEATVLAHDGQNAFVVNATDGNGNVRTNSYEIDVTGHTATYQYDANGNLTQRTEAGETWAYEWNAVNQLTRVTRDGAEVARFRYDPIGRRVEKVAGGATTRYTYDGSWILREAAGSVARLYVHGPTVDEPLATVDEGTGTTTYYHANAQGSIVKTTDSSGAVLQFRRYDPWGRIDGGSTASGYAYTGREWDAETGLYYYRARYYDPRTARFLSEDPRRFSEGTNFYRYVNDNPTTWRDPSGLWALAIGLAESGSVAWGPGAVVEGSASIVKDSRGNWGFMACKGAGIGVGGDAAAGLGGALSVCPTCDTICGLAGPYAGGFVTGEMGVGAWGSGGAVGEQDAVINLNIGLAVGEGVFAAATIGECTVTGSGGQRCDDCQERKR